MSIFKEIIGKDEVFKKYDLTDSFLKQLINQKKIIEGFEYKKIGNSNSYIFDKNLINQAMNQDFSKESDKDLSLKTLMGQVLTMNETLNIYGISQAQLERCCYYSLTKGIDYDCIDNNYIFLKESLNRLFKEELYEKLSVIESAAGVIGNLYVEKFGKRRLIKCVKKVSQKNGFLGYSNFIECTEKMMLDIGMFNCMFDLNILNKDNSGNLKTFDAFRNYLSMDFYPENREVLLNSFASIVSNIKN